MKIKIDGEKYKYITDNSLEIDEEGAFLLTQHNQKYKKEVERKGVNFFLKAEDLIKKWDLEEIKIIGITGTNGKTTITNLIAYALKGDFKVAVSGTEGVFLHYKNEIEKIAPRTHTTPEILTTLNNLKIAKEFGAEFFIMEVSSHGIFQRRIEGLKFASKVFSNLSQDHLDFHKNMEEYARVKSSFFADNSPKVINLDDQWINYNSENLLSYSLKNPKADILAQNYNFKNGIESEIIYGDKIYSGKFQLRGKFNLSNILASLGAIIQTTNLKIEDILVKMADFRGVGGRMELIYEREEKGAKMEILIDYAHTPDAIENVLKSLKSDSKKIITIIGAGGDRDREKRPLMAQVALENSDYLFLTSDNPRSEEPKEILKNMEEGIKGKENYLIIEDRAEAIKKAFKKSTEILNGGENIILAILGKGDEDYMEIKGEKIPYSDKEVIEEIVKK